jgi:phage recombination protein Bet
VSTDVAVYQGNQFSKDQLDLIKRTLAPGTTNDQFELFIEFCKQLNLNPFARQIYAVVRKEKQYDGSYMPKMTIQTSIDGYRLLAERSGKYAGQLGPQWCGKDGKWVDVWTSDDPPYAARVGVLRADFKEPLWSVAKYASYVQKDKNNNPTVMWLKFADLLLAKCAEALSLRRGFPAELSGVYTKEEMMQADTEHNLPAQVLAHETAIEAEAVEQPAQNGHAEPTPPVVARGRATYAEGVPTVKELQARCNALCGVGFWQAMVQKVLHTTEIVKDSEITIDGREKIKKYLDFTEQQKAAKTA